jgi:hypothetical protein
VLVVWKVGKDGGSRRCLPQQAELVVLGRASPSWPCWWIAVWLGSNLTLGSCNHRGCSECGFASDRGVVWFFTLCNLWFKFLDSLVEVTLGCEFDKGKTWKWRPDRTRTAFFLDEKELILTYNEGNFLFGVEGFSSSGASDWLRGGDGGGSPFLYLNDG